MKKIRIEATYSYTVETLFGFPEGKTVADISDWWIKWESLCIKWKDGTVEELDQLAFSENHEDHKTPHSANMYKNNELVDSQTFKSTDL